MRKKKPYVKISTTNFKSMKKNLKTKGKKEERKILSRKIEKLQQLVEKGEGGEKTNGKSDTKHSHRKKDLHAKA